MGTTRHNDDELRDAPILRSIPRTDPFTAPEGFFEHFPHQVQAMAVARDARRTAWPPWARRIAWALPMVLAAVVLWWALGTGPGTPAGNGLAEADTEWYLPWEWDDDDELYAALSGNGDDPMPGLGLDEAELMAYVDHENLDIHLLIDEP